MPHVPPTLDDWPQLRPGFWQLRLPGSRLYQIEATPEGFRCMVSHIQSSWIGPQGRPSGWGQPPYLATGQEAVDAAVAHFSKAAGSAS